MGNTLNLNDVKNLSEKIAEFSEKNLNENEQKIFNAIFTVYEKAVSKENAPVIFGKDPGFISEINAAIEKEGEVQITVTPAVVRTITWTIALTTTLMSGDSPTSCK